MNYNYLVESGFDIVKPMVIGSSHWISVVLHLFINCDVEQVEDDVMGYFPIIVIITAKSCAI